MLLSKLLPTWMPDASRSLAHGIILRKYLLLHVPRDSPIGSYYVVLYGVHVFSHVIAFC